MPTLPVTCEVPVLVTAPLVEKRTKLAAVPRLGACAELILGLANKAKAVMERSNLFFNAVDLSERTFTLQRCSYLLPKALHN